MQREVVGKGRTQAETVVCVSVCVCVCVCVCVFSAPRTAPNTLVGKPVMNL